MSKYINSWKILVDNVESNLISIAPIDLCDKMLHWAKGFSEDNNYKELYNRYIEYYAKLNLQFYIFDEEWYSYSLLLKDFLATKDKYETMKSLIPKVGDILNEIIVFKSDRNCKLIGEENLRVFYCSKNNEYYFCCDGCGYCENIEGTTVEISGPCLPVTANQVKLIQINPSKENS